jgi:HTH-type transcriptional regulator/antitoxin HigA
MKQSGKKNGRVKLDRTMARAKNSPFGPAPGAEATDRHFELVRLFPLRPLRSDAELDAAIAVINSLIDMEELSSGGAVYLEVLGCQVDKYETEHHPMPPVSAADMLRHLIEARETTQCGVASETEIALSTISEILARKRGLNRRHIEAFARYFRVSPAVFIGS